MTLHRLSRVKAIRFESRVVGGTVPKEYIPGVEKGIRTVWDTVLWLASR